MTPQELYSEARRRGLRLEPRGASLAVIPAKLCGNINMSFWHGSKQENRRSRPTALRGSTSPDRFLLASFRGPIAPLWPA
jgi:hypothetical protein